MNTLRTYNIERVNWLSLTAQKEAIERYWGDRVKSICVNKEDRRYIAVVVRV